MTNIAVKHGGTVDKYIGDAIMVFFGDPQSRGHKEDAGLCSDGVGNEVISMGNQEKVEGQRNLPTFGYSNRYSYRYLYSGEFRLSRSFGLYDHW